MSEARPSVAVLIARAANDGAAASVGGGAAIDHVRRRVGRITGAKRIIELDADVDRRRRARRDRAWSPTAWRGGIGGASVYDEYLDPGRFAAALRQANATAGLVVGADWPLVDPALCDAVIERYTGQPEHQMVFTQAPPGVCGVVITVELLERMAGHGATIGAMLDYHPQAPQPDPIGRDVCVAIAPAVRDAPVRAITDAKRWTTLIDQAWPDDDTPAALSRMTATLAGRGHACPQQITVELTPRRVPTGPLIAVSQVDVDRPDMAADTLDAIARFAEADTDLALTIGGLGDPLAHPDWPALAPRLGAMGFAAIAIETDLLCDDATLDTLGLADVVKVRLNADSAATYQRVMGVDRLEHAVDAMRRLVERHPDTRLVPSFVKCRDNVHEMEAFFDRWLRACGAALIEGPSTGVGLIDDVGVIDMAPPRRFTCGQLSHRMSVHSDGAVPRCDQDWLAREAVGNVNDQPLAALWARLQDVRREHERGVYRGLCEPCRVWFRP